MHSRRTASKLIVAALLVAFLVHDAIALSATWDITMDYRSPDCHDMPVLLVNNHFPGPELRIQPGEKVSITVHNHVETLSISVHFHGQNQLGTPYMDGSNMVSSCPTGPHQSFKYEFTANDSPGTFMYHLHGSGTRHLGVYGFLIAEDRPTDPLYMPNLAGEHSLVIADLYHAPVDALVHGLLSPRYLWPDAPEALLINGAGKTAECASGEKTEACSRCPHTRTFKVTAGGQYRLRISSLTSLSDVNLVIQGHNMTVIEVDDHPVTPIVVPSLDLSTGQRYSVLIDANRAPSAYRISVGTFYDSQAYISGTYAILKYADSAIADPGPQSQTVLNHLHHVWHMDTEYRFQQQRSFRGLAGHTPPVPTSSEVTRRFVMHGLREYYEAGAQTSSGDPRTHCSSEDGTRPLRYGVSVARPWEVDPEHPSGATAAEMTRATYFGEHQVPVALSVYAGHTHTFTQDRAYFAVEEGDVVEIVMQNWRSCSGHCKSHPWHLHGHHFWVVGSGRGEWIGSEEQLAMLQSGDSAVYRDTVSMVGDEKAVPLTPCGWTILRFKANNPGAWSFHCHNEWHAVMGMGTVIWYQDGSLPPPPPHLPCFKTHIGSEQSDHSNGSKVHPFNDTHLFGNGTHQHPGNDTKLHDGSFDGDGNGTEAKQHKLPGPSHVLHHTGPDWVIGLVVLGVLGLVVGAVVTVRRWRTRRASLMEQPLQYPDLSEEDRRTSLLQEPPSARSAAAAAAESVRKRSTVPRTPSASSSQPNLDSPKGAAKV